MPKKKISKKNKMDVSYGVEDASIKKEDPTKAEKQEASAKAPEPVKKNLIHEINEMKANNETKTPEFSKKMGDLEKILGVDQINPFGTNELDVFEEKLKAMTESDLQDIAYKVGMNPYVPGPQLKNMLRGEFKSYNRNNMRNAMPTKTEAIKLDPNNPDHAETIKILGEI